MNASLKRRLLIAIIIVALVVIFLPIPFGNVHFRTPSTRSQQIPPAPQQSVATLPGQSSPAVNNSFIPLSNPTPVSGLAAPQNTPLATPQNNAMTLSGAAPATATQPIQTATDLTTQTKLTTSVPPVVSTQQPMERAAKKESIKIIPGNLTAISTDKDIGASVVDGDADDDNNENATKIPIDKETGEHSKKSSTPQLNDGSTVVGQLNAASSKEPIYITQSALGSNVLPYLHLRKSDIDSANVSSNHAVSTNIHVAQTMNKAWVIQLGSFDNPVQTDRVVRVLRDHGYAAFSYKTTVDNIVMYRVYVGPFLQETQAQEKQQAIIKQFKLPGYIHSFEAETLN